MLCVTPTVRSLYAFVILKMCSKGKKGGLGKIILILIAQVAELGLAVRRAKDELNLGTDERQVW